MTKRRKPPLPKPPRPGTRDTGTAEPDLPSLIELERFTTASLHQWRSAATRLEALNRTLYNELESLRQRHAPQLIAALRSVATGPLPIQDWSRVVDYRYALEPLSTTGSIKHEGGRFNIGARLSPGAFSAFPALYLADSYGTAFLERFGTEPGVRGTQLTAEELALRKPTSFTQVRVRGLIENVVDVGDLASLRPIVDILKAFQMPKAVTTTTRQLGIRSSPWLVRSTVTLQRQLLHRNWRMLPMQFDLPSNSQIFGRLAAGAGVHGILYPSAKDSSHRCLALFPQNWAGTASFVEVADSVPDEARVTRIDGMMR